MSVQEKKSTRESLVGEKTSASGGWADENLSDGRDTDGNIERDREEEQKHLQRNTNKVIYEDNGKPKKKKKRRTHLIAVVRK